MSKFLIIFLLLVIWRKINCVTQFSKGVEKMKRWFIPLLIVWLFFSVSLVEASSIEELDLKIKGKVEENINYKQDLNEWSSITIFDLELKKDFGYSTRLVLLPQLKYEYKIDEKDELKLGLKEGYLDVYFNSVDLRIGQQVINWGSGYKLNPSDKINPIDFTAIDPTDADLGVLAFKADYYVDFDTILTGVIVGKFKPALLPQDLEEEQETVLSEEIYNNLVEIFHNQEIAKAKMANLIVSTIEPEINSLNEVEYALKVTQRGLFGYDVSLSYFSGYEDFPVLNSNMEEVISSLAMDQLTLIEFGYKRTNSVSIDAIGSILDCGVWTEIAYNVNEDEDKSIELVLGGDYTFENNLYAVIQYYQQNYYAEEKEAVNIWMLYGEIPIKQIHRFKTTLVYDITQQAILINPEINISLNNNLNLKIGSTYLDDQESQLNMLGEKQTYIGVGYSF